MTVVSINAEDAGKYKEQVRGLFITAIVFAFLGFASKLAAAAGLSALDPIKILETQLINRLGTKLDAARAASILNFLLDSLISLAIILVCVGVGLINGYFDPVPEDNE